MGKLNLERNNTNNMLHLFTKLVNKNSLRWEVGLRSYHPDRSDGFRFVDSKFHRSNIKIIKKA